MIIILCHEETHSECNYFGTDVASCVHIHPTATPNNPHTFTRKVCHTGAQKVWYRSNRQTFTDKLIIEWIWNVRAVSFAKEVTGNWSKTHLCICLERLKKTLRLSQMFHLTELDQIFLAADEDQCKYLTNTIMKDLVSSQTDKFFRI